MKTRTSHGFKVSEYILEFPNNGNIAVCEGPFTAASAYSLGYYAICTFGSNISKIKLEKITNIAKRLNKRVGIAIENKSGGIDLANQKAYDKVVKYMFWQQIETFRIFPYDKDLNDALINGKAVEEQEIKDFVPALPRWEFVI
jgi:MinD superfamily P-loop ATPase